MVVTTINLHGSNRRDQRPHRANGLLSDRVAATRSSLDGERRTRRRSTEGVPPLFEIMIATFVFLEMNGYVVEAPELEAFTMFIGLAAGEVGESELAAWLADSCA